MSNVTHHYAKNHLDVSKLLTTLLLNHHLQQRKIDETFYGCVTNDETNGKTITL